MGQLREEALALTLGTQGALSLRDVKEMTQDERGWYLTRVSKLLKGAKV